MKRSFRTYPQSAQSGRVRNCQLWSRAVAIALLSVVAATPRVIAQETETFPPSPLEIIEPDPLLPRLVIDRPLSPQERRVLTTALEELGVQAEAKLRTGDISGAFEIWNRELRLRRVLSVQEEVAALSRVGEVAWRENQTTEVRVITQRLQQIQQEVQVVSPPDFSTLLTIAQAYQRMRAIDPAVGLYQQILTLARASGDRPTEVATLTAMGELYFAWFDYPNAATAYQELLTLARAGGDRIQEIEYLEKLSSIYQQDTQAEQAIAIQQQLVNVYESRQEYFKIPPLKLAIGDNYLSLNRPDLAASSYQEAFAVSRSGQQYSYAADALQKLAALYQSLNRLDDTLVVYQLLMDVQQQSYDNLGMMNTYDQIGQLQQSRGNTAQALAAFQRGLQLAQQLNYKVSYFTTQIQAVSSGSPQ